MKRMPNQRYLWPKVAAITLIAAPLLGLVGLLTVYAVNVPFWDQWELVPLIQKMHDGTLSFGDLFAQHNEHRIVFPRIIMLALASLTNWNVLFEVAVNVALAVATFGLLVLLVCHTFKASRLRIAALFLLSVIIFSPAQFENWLWGWQIQWFLNVLGLVLAVWALGVWHSSAVNKVLVAAIGATIATFSLASGIFVWAVCVPLFLHKSIRSWLPVWLVLGIGAFAAYYVGYVSTGSSSLFFVAHLPQFAAYVTTYLALPLSMHMKLALWIGVLYIPAAAGVVWLGIKKFGRAWWQPLAVWLSLGLYGLCGALATGVSRLPLGIEQAYSSRYQTIACLVAAACVVTLLKFWENSTGRYREYAAVGLLALTLLVGANYAKGALQMSGRHTPLVQTQQCAKLAASINDPCLGLLYPDPQVLWPRLQYLRSIHWGGL